MAQIRVAFGLFYPKGDFLVYSSGRDMWVLSLAFAQIDPATGRALSEFEPLWTPTAAATVVRESRMYTFTPDGLAYSLQLSAAGR
ncbi:MAG: hypothetical protein HY646_14395 [Acidobacteria bacterium]|nr:hypothetical protein [Acidobacteriota bacterium]